MKERRSYDAERNLKLVTTPLVCLSDVSKQFERIRALDHVSLAIPEGRIIGLLGPNGSGKTTMLKILAGLYTEYEGSVSIDGLRPGAKTKACVAYLPDSSCLPEKMLVSDIVRLYEIFFADFDAEKCRELLAAFAIGLSKTPEEMSKGMIDKLQISLVMARRARLYLLDEPIGGVDVEAREHVLDLILENFNPKGTMLIVTHLIHDIERLFDDVIVLKEGRVETFAASDSLRAQYGGSLEEALKAMFREEAAR